MGIERFNTYIKNNDATNSSLSNSLNGTKINHLFVDSNSIIYEIIGIIENEINTLRYHCLQETLSDNDMMICQKYFDDTNFKEVIDKTNKLKYEKILDIISKLNVRKHALKMILNKIMDLCRIVNSDDELETIYIAIDGMPNMSKIWKQRERRYTSFITSKLQKKIFQDFKNSIPNIRKRFEENKFRFDRSAIMPNSSLMDGIAGELNSEHFKKLLKETFPNLKSTEINSHINPGEGEKKIMERILSEKNPGNYCIHSPDSDMIIMSMIICVQFGTNYSTCESTFHVAKPDNVSKNYQFLNINEMMREMYKTILKKINTYKSVKQSDISVLENNIMNDIAFIISFFGNDFIPKIYTIDIDIHMNLIMDRYVESFMIINSINNKIDKSDSDIHSFDNYLVKKIGNDYSINWIFFSKFIENLAEIEHWLYSDVYIQKYYNSKWLKKFMIKPTITESLYLFINAINDNIFPVIVKRCEGYKITDNIINNTVSSVYKYFGVKDVQKLIDVLGTSSKIDMIDSYLKKNGICKKDIECYKCSVIFTKFMLGSHKFDTNKPPLDTNEWNIYNDIKFFLENFSPEKRHHLLKSSINHCEIRTDNIYHNNNIRKKLLYDELNITDYDREIYKLDKKMGIYSSMMNYNPDLDMVGKLSIRYYRSNGVIKYEIDQKNAKNNYRKFIKDYLDINHNDHEKRLRMTQEYIIGLCWVLNFYMNRNKPHENLKYVSVWFYKYNYSPTLHMINMYLKEIMSILKKKRHVDDTNNETSDTQFQNFMEYHTKKIFSISNKSMFVERNKFLTREEHYMFVTPVNKNDKNRVQKHYLELRSNKQIFPDLEEMIDNMYDKRGTMESIRGEYSSPFTNKGKLNRLIMPNITFDKYVDLLKKHKPDRK